MSWKSKLALWLLRLDKKQILIVPIMTCELIDAAKELTGQMKKVDTSGEYKRAQVLRALMNRLPNETEGNCARAIELVLCGAAS